MLRRALLLLLQLLVLLLLLLLQPLLLTMLGEGGADVLAVWWYSPHTQNHHLSAGSCSFVCKYAKACLDVGGLSKDC